MKGAFNMLSVIFLASIIAYTFLLIYCILLLTEKLVVRRINDFYIIKYSFPYPIVGLKMSRRLRKQKLAHSDLERRLNRCTSALCKHVPAGIYRAHTHDRVLQGLEHMERRGRAKLLQKKKKGKPRKLRREYKAVFGRKFDFKVLERKQMYNVKFQIY